MSMESCIFWVGRMLQHHLRWRHPAFIHLPGGSRTVPSPSHPLASTKHLRSSEGVA